MMNVPKFHIINLTPADWQKARNIRLEALKTNPEVFGSSYAKEIEYPQGKWQSRLEPFSKSGSWAVYAADETDEIVGSVGAYLPENGVPHIVGVYVTPRMRKYGVGRMLFAELIDRIKKESSFSEMELDVNKDNVAAIRLYENFGFKIVSEKDSLQGDGKKHRTVYMRAIINRHIS